MPDRAPGASRVATRLRAPLLALVLGAPAAVAGQPADSVRARAQAESLLIATAAAEIAADSARTARALRDSAEARLVAAVPFARGSAVLGADAARDVDEKAWYLWLNPRLRIRLVGASDADTAPAGDLAIRRALAVRARLVEAGIDQSQVQVATDAPDDRGGAVRVARIGEITVAVTRAPDARIPPPPNRHGLRPEERRPARWGTVRIFYATDRRRTGSGDPATFYGADRAPGGALEYGTAEVTIPRVHRPGITERPSWYRLEFSASPDRHIVLARVAPKDGRTFFDSLRATVARSSAKEAFVFVHGYNVTFDAAAMRTAQLAYDLGFSGAPILYSWPSKGSVFRYSADREEADWTAEHLQRFLGDVVRVTGARRVHLIAHSMGNRALTLALQRLAPAADTVFNQVVLAAPDIDRDVFTQQIAPAIRPAARRVTIYASERDKALRVSRLLSTHARVGASARGVMVADGMDTVDASSVDTDLLGHGYFAENRLLIDDLVRLLAQQQPPDRRPPLLRMTSGDGPYWRFP